MLLNLGIIKHRLSAVPESVCGDIDHELLLHTVRLMPSAVDVEYNPGHLYVMQWDKRPNSDRLPSHMVCIGGGREAEGRPHGQPVHRARSDEGLYEPARLRISYGNFEKL